MQGARRQQSGRFFDIFLVSVPCLLNRPKWFRQSFIATFLPDQTQTIDMNVETMFREWAAQCRLDQRANPFYRMHKPNALITSRADPTSNSNSHHFHRGEALLLSLFFQHLSTMVESRLELDRYEVRVGISFLPSGQLTSSGSATGSCSHFGRVVPRVGTVGAYARQQRR